jgi:hypothetical protein
MQPLNHQYESMTLSTVTTILQAFFIIEEINIWESTESQAEKKRYEDSVDAKPPP